MNILLKKFSNINSVSGDEFSNFLISAQHDSRTKIILESFAQDLFR